LQAAHHDGRHLPPLKREAVIYGSEEVYEFLEDDFDEFFVGAEAEQNASAVGCDCNIFNEFADDIDVDVGFDEGSLDHGYPIPHIRFCQLTFTLERLKGGQKAIL
jgi:hypothetical protein